MLDIRTRLGLELCYENCRSRNKIPCVEFGEDVVIVSNKDNEEIEMYDLMLGMPERLVMVKKEAMTMAKRTIDEVAQRISLNNQGHVLKTKH